MGLPAVREKKLPSSAFKPGNQVAAGHKGRNASRPDFLTQALISQLHEIDRDTKSERLHLLASRLLCHALGGKYKTDDGRWVQVDSSVHAIKEVFDRVQGKVAQSFSFEDPEGGSTLKLEIIEHVVVDPVKR